jgi:hypothetical protein
MQLRVVRETMIHQTEALNTISESERRLKELYQDSERNLEMLRMDKAYLQRELSNSVLKANDVARDAEKYQAAAFVAEEKVFLYLYSLRYVVIYMYMYVMQ